MNVWWFARNRTERKTKPGEVNLTRLSDMFNKQLRNALRTPIESPSVRGSIIGTLRSYVTFIPANVLSVFLAVLFFIYSFRFCPIRIRLYTKSGQPTRSIWYTHVLLCKSYETPKNNLFVSLSVLSSFLSLFRSCTQQNAHTHTHTHTYAYSVRIIPLLLHILLGSPFWDEY